MKLSVMQKQEIMHKLFKISKLVDSDQYKWVCSPEKMSELVQDKSFTDLGLDSLETFEFLIELEDIVPGLHADILDLTADATFLDLIKAIEAQ